MYSHCRRPLAFSYKIEHTSVITLLDIHPKELLTYSHTKTCTEIFTAALFIIGKTWKQPRCPSVGKRINWNTQAMKYYSVLKRNELPSYEKTQRNLKCILLNERSQSEKAP